jgi:hypothetical protein
MKKILFFIFLLAITFESFSQSLISGRVIDSETKEPIESVYIQNRNRPENSILSDKEGLFSIIVALSDTLDFHRIGYVFNSYRYKKEGSVNIALKPTEYDLSEITITYGEANRILQKAIYNLKANYVHEPLTYLWHGVETEKNKKEKKESYALYSAKLGKMNPHKIQIPFDLKLIELNHPTNNVQTSKILERSQISTLFHSIPVDWESIAKFDNLLKVDSENDSLIFIKSKLNRIDEYTCNSIEFIVNKSDTVLSYLNICIQFNHKNKERAYKKAKFLGINRFTYAVDGMNVTLSIGKKGNAYYFKNVKLNSLISFLVDKKEELVEFENTTVFLNDTKGNTKQEYKKLQGHTEQLYKLEATTTDRFWEKFSHGSQ